MAQYNGLNIVAGKHTLILSATTIGHTEDGAIIDAKEESFQIKSHESGAAPIAEYTGGRSFQIHVKTLQMDKTMLPILFPDATVGASGTLSFTGLNMHKKKTPHALALHPDARTTATQFNWTFSAVVPQTPNLSLVLKKGEKYIVPVTFTQLFTTGSMAKISILPAA